MERREDEKSALLGILLFVILAMLIYDHANADLPTVQDIQIEYRY